MSKIIDLTGKRFGRWVALALHPERNRVGLARWVCRCDCGSERIVLGSNLRSGATTSCRCLIDLTGNRFSRWTVLARHSERSHIALWLCRCDCCNEGIVRGINSIGGLSKSCGCLARERATKHGLSGSRIWCTWHCVKARCFNPQHSSYPRYGGRGIAVCPRWLVLENFYADMGDPPDGWSLDRINNDGSYEPGNCRWATASMQRLNNAPGNLARRGYEH